MKKIILLLSIVTCFTNVSMAQTSNQNSKINAELKTVANIFMNCLIKNDSVGFYNLFNENPITFVRLYKKSVKDDYYKEDYKAFFRTISKLKLTKQEIYNLKIQQDDYMSSLTFDYTFFKGGKKKISGNQSWGLIFKNNSWRINRVLYALETN